MAFLTSLCPLMALSLAQGVSVTQTGVVLSTVFIATIVFTPLFGKVTSRAGGGPGTFFSTHGNHLP